MYELADFNDEGPLTMSERRVEPGSLPDLSIPPGYLTHCLLQLPVRAFHILGDNLRIGQHWEEVCVPVPSGHDMDVHVTCNTGPTRTPDIHPDIKTVRMRDVPKEFNRQLRSVHQIQTLVVIQFLKSRLMSIRYNHEVTAVIGKQVHDDEGFSTLPHDEAIRIIFQPLHAAENTFP
jgi:hypothetical protein